MRRAGAPLAVLAGLAVMAVLQAHEERLRHGRSPAEAVEISGGLPPGVAASALGGLRTPVLAALWIESDHLLREQRYWALRSRYELIVRLEPRIPSAWGFVADLMFLNLADRASDPDRAWAWRREGLEFLDRGIAANPDNYLLRIQRWARVLVSIGRDPESRRRFRAWKGRTVEEEALRLGRDLAARYPDDPGEVTRPAQVLKAFAFLEFHEADSEFGKDPEAAREGYLRAAARWRRTAEEYGKHPWAAGDFPRYAEAFASLSESLVGVEDPAVRARLVRQKLGPFKNYVEAATVLEGL